MKKRKMWGATLIASAWLLGFCCLACGLVWPSYAEARRQLAWSYFDSLEVPLADSGLQDLDQLETNIRRFESNFVALKVGNNHKPALEKAHGILERAGVLKAQASELDAEAYQVAYAALRADVKLVPRIGKDAFYENNPWLVGLVSYTWTSWVLTGCLLIWAVVVVPVVLFMASDANESKSDDSSSGGGYGGGGYGGYGGGGYGSMPPPYYPPMYPPPFGGHGHGNNGGYPPWGSV